MAGRFLERIRFIRARGTAVILAWGPGVPARSNNCDEMLTQRTVVPYLLQRKLISEQAIVEGDLAVVDTSRRNCNFEVISKRGPCYLLKQGVEPDGIKTVRHEATVLTRVFTRLVETLGLIATFPALCIRCEGTSSYH